MKKIVLLFIFTYNLFACTLCSIYAPNVHINTTIVANDKNTTFDVYWEFDQSFVDTLVVYDENLNNKFDDPEVALVQEALEVYLKENHYLTYIAFQHKDENATGAFIYKINKPIITTTLDMKKLVFNYKFDLDFVLQEDKKLTVAYYDAGNNFNFIPKDTIVKNYHKTQIIEFDKNQFFVHFYNPLTKKKKLMKVKKILKL